MVVDRDNEEKVNEHEKQKKETKDFVKTFRGILREQFEVKVPEEKMSFLVCVVTEREGEDIKLGFLASGNENEKLIMIRQMLAEILKKHPVVGMVSLLNAITGLSGSGKVVGG